MGKALRRTLIAAAAAALPVGAIIGINMTANAAGSFPAHYAAPYLQITGSDAGDMVNDMKASGDKFYTLAFIIPHGCTPIWEADGSGLGAFLTQVHAIQNAGGQVIVSNGGAAGGEMATGCSNVSTLTSVYAKEASTYGTKRLDFDIEGGTLSNTGANDRRAKALAALQKQDPSIQVDFTVATDPGGMPSEVMNMLKNAVSNGVKINLVNIMTMDFGSGSNLNQGISASKGAHSQIASLFPGLSSAQLWAKLGATFIAGRNDDGTFFSASDAGKFETFAAQNGMGELSFWEVHDYDRTNASSNGGAWAYSKTFNKITGGTNPSPPPSSNPPGTTRFEAEKAALTNAVVATNHPGFSGTGFVDYAAAAGSSVKFTVSRSAAGSVKLTFRYANGSTANRPCNLIVNGATVSAPTFASTGTWDTWKTVSVTVSLKSGSNTIAVTATTAPGGPNLDALDVA